MRTTILLGLVVFVGACGDDSTDLDDDTPRFEFTDFRALPDSGCEDDRIEFWADYDVLPIRDVTFEMEVGGTTLEQGLIRGTAFQNGRLFIVSKDARRIRELGGYGDLAITLSLEEANGEAPRAFGPMSLDYTADDCR